jgi:myo-inositol-1(or 4)-monophosphatase
MIDWQVPVVRDLLLEAGRIALTHFESPQTEHKADQSLVTVADTAVEEHLRSRVADGSDPARLIGEESADGWTQAAIDTALTGATWVVDPIDGTAPYANQLPTWGISLGLMVDGALTDGALFLPRTGEMFITSGEDVLFERGARNPEYWRFDALAPLRPDLRAYDSTAMVSLPREIIHTGRFSGPNPIQSNGSAVYSIAKLLTGSYICYVARVKLWDLAGAIPILHRIGYPMVFRNGNVLTTRVADGGWVLDAGSPRLWKCDDLIFIASGQDTVTYMQESYTSGRR